MVEFVCILVKYTQKINTEQFKIIEKYQLSGIIQLKYIKKISIADIDICSQYAINLYIHKC